VEGNGKTNFILNKWVFNYQKYVLPSQIEANFINSSLKWFDKTILGGAKLERSSTEMLDFFCAMT
jgi:hypothetical protein